MRGGVGPEQDAILIFLEKPLSRSGLSSQLSDPSRDVHGHVGESVEVLRHISKTFGEVSDVEHNKLSSGMSGEHPISGLEQLRIAGEVAGR